MKHAGDVVEILEAFDLTGSLREAARLTGCSPMTVARYVRLRERGQAAPDPVRRDQILDPYLAKLEEWVERSHGRVRADVAHEKLLRPRLRRLRADHAACGGRDQARVRGRPSARLPALDPRARHVVPVRLGQGPPDRRARHAALVRLARLEPVPGGHPDLGPHAADGDRLPRRDAAPVRRRPHLCPHRQRADGHGRPGGRDRREAPDPRRRGPPLWPRHPRLRAGRPGVQGRLREHGQDRQGRPRPDRGEPARGVPARSPLSGSPAPRSAPRSTSATIARPGGRRSSCSPTSAGGSTRCPSSRTRSPSGSPASSTRSRRSATARPATRVPHKLVGERVWVRVDGDELVVVHQGPRRSPRGRPPRAHDARQPADRSGPLSRADRPIRSTRGRGPVESRRDRVPRARRGCRALADPRRGLGHRADPDQDAPGDRARRPRRRRLGRGGPRPRGRGRPLRRRRPRVDPRPPAPRGRPGGERLEPDDDTLQPGTGAWEGLGR